MLCSYNSQQRHQQHKSISDAEEVKEKTCFIYLKRNKIRSPYLMVIFNGMLRILSVAARLNQILSVPSPTPQHQFWRALEHKNCHRRANLTLRFFIYPSDFSRSSCVIKINPDLKIVFKFYLRN